MQLHAKLNIEKKAIVFTSPASHVSNIEIGPAIDKLLNHLDGTMPSRNVPTKNKIELIKEYNGDVLSSSRMFILMFLFR